MADRRSSYTEVVEAIPCYATVAVPELVNTIVKAVQQAKAAERDAWQSQSAYRIGDRGRGMSQASRDIECAYQQGRAHAFCEVLGDQPHLSSALRMLCLDGVDGL